MLAEFFRQEPSPKVNFDPSELAKLKTVTVRSVFEGKGQEAFNLECQVLQKQFGLTESNANRAGALIYTAGHFQISTEVGKRIPINDDNLERILLDYQTTAKTCLLKARTLISTSSRFNYDPEEATQADLEIKISFIQGKIPETVESVANYLSAIYNLPQGRSFEIARRRERALTILSGINRGLPTETTWKAIEESMLDYYSKIADEVS